MTGDGNAKGFTFLEVLIALAILAGVITTVVVTFNRHLNLAMEDREKTTAILLARARMEEPDFFTSSKADGNFAPDFSEITWKREQTRSDYPGLKRYLMTVSWQSGHRSLKLVTYASQ